MQIKTNKTTYILTFLKLEALKDEEKHATKLITVYQQHKKYPWEKLTETSVHKHEKQ